MEASIKVGLKIDQDVYEIDVAIPSGKPTTEKPYTFSIKESGENKPQLLNVVVADKSHYYVAVSPPEQVKEWTADTVQSLEVVVNEGNYTPGSGFKPTTEQTES
ncbi:hypothetical protein [Vibrio splendidus]|uniref:hypothetical protein n=1 Tax=Vibrio splendidus TaxID=29497 RepID=UPI000C815170|nr:hypothetical protein [Vibrio splendidus]PMJ71677.1 hypothetical protein BCU23_01980 [Vibrio splendidus]